MEEPGERTTQPFAERISRHRGWRVGLVAVLWFAILVALAVFADPLVWLGILLGMLLPVSLWVAWDGFHYPQTRDVEYFLAMTPREFEQTVADLIVPLGYADIRVVGGAADLGVDVLCRDREGQRVAIQCKRYSPTNEITSSQVQTFMGGMVAHGAARGIIVTTSTFTGPARNLAQNQGIRLIDGDELTRKLARGDAR